MWRAYSRNLFKHCSYRAVLLSFTFLWHRLYKIAWRHFAGEVYCWMYGWNQARTAFGGSSREKQCDQQADLCEYHWSMWVSLIFATIKLREYVCSRKVTDEHLMSPCLFPIVAANARIWNQLGCFQYYWSDEFYQVYTEGINNTGLGLFLYASTHWWS